MDEIKELGSVTAQTPQGMIQCLTIIGQVEGHQVMPEDTKTTKYEHVMPLLAAVEESEEIKGLLILLNTVGGDVEAGLGIAELIAGMKKPTVSLILGGGHSIGVPLAVAAKRSFIAPSAAMTIHPVRLNGVVIGVPQTYNYFARIQERIVGFVTSHSNISRERYNELMLATDEIANDVGSVIYGEEAVSCGLIDSIGTLSDALDYLHSSCDEAKKDSSGCLFLLLCFLALYDRIRKLSIHNIALLRRPADMTIGEAIILGLVQGIAEFLPISSSGHLAILQNLFNMSDIEGGHMLFDVLLHFGTLIAICFMYWNDIKAMVVEVLALLSGRKAVTADGRPKQYTAARMFFLIVAATLPLVLILPINDYIGELSKSTVFVGIALILTGFMLLVSDKMTPGTKTEKNMRFSDALIIGLCQCVATLPGLSRSGTTITAGIATGQNRGYAVKFSLLMSIPAVLGATLLELIKAIKTGIDASLIPAYLFGMVAAMVSGVLAIGLLKMIAKSKRFGGFAYYCWIVGALTIILSMIF